MRVRLSDRTITIVPDSEHLAAHRRDFLVPMRRILQYAARSLDPSPVGVRVLTALDGADHVHRWIQTPETVGLAGVRLAGRSAFWAYRRGRVTPSHLVRGRKRRTRRLTMHGRWDGPDRFLLRTVYAGDPAPREIHDPKITLAELPRSVAFWAEHAIVVGPGDYTDRPHLP